MKRKREEDNLYISVEMIDNVIIPQGMGSPYSHATEIDINELVNEMKDIGAIGFCGQTEIEVERKLTSNKRFKLKNNPDRVLSKKDLTRITIPGLYYN